MAERMTEKMTAQGESNIAPLFQSGAIMIGKFDHKTNYVARPGLEDIKLFFIFNSAEFEIYPANKC